MKKYYFKPKKYGYGITPITIEGWLATFFLLGLVLLSAYANNFFSGEIMGQEGIRFCLEILVFAWLFKGWSIDKTDGEIKWNWGK